MGRIQKEWMDEGKFSHVHVDGTFCCSTGCQVVAVFGRRHKKDLHPDLLFCAVVNGKFREDYDIIFAALKEMAPGFCPVTFTGDFEGPMWRSFEEAFGAVFQGCLFHLLDAIGRQLFVKNVPPLFHKGIKALIRDVAMAPSDEFHAASVSTLWAVVGIPGGTAGSAPGCREFAQYFSDSYIDGAVAPIDRWCLKDRALTANDPEDLLGIDMTNNPAETVNRALNAFVEVHKAAGRGDFALLAAINEFSFSRLLLRNLYAGAYSPDGRVRLPARAPQRSKSSLSALGAQAASAVRGQQLDRSAARPAPDEVIRNLLPSLQEFYKSHSPLKVGDAEGLLRGYPLFDVAASLHRKYGSVPAGFPLPQQQLAQPQPPPRAAGHPDLDPALASLIEFFQRANPSMVRQAEQLLSSHSPQDLASALRKKYGCCPGGFGSWGGFQSPGSVACGSAGAGLAGVGGAGLARAGGAGFRNDRGAGCGGDEGAANGGGGVALACRHRARTKTR